jgi:hypothetical protein
MNHRALLATFTLPLDLCPTENYRHEGMRAGKKRDALLSMRAQMLRQGIRPGTLYPNGCLIVCTRHSPTEPDSTGWDKIPIDQLTPPEKKGRHQKNGLWLIGGDSTAHISRAHHFVKCKRGEGRVTIEIYSPCTLTAPQIMRAFEAYAATMGADEMLRCLDRAIR